jgi:hypothetical protein
MLSAPMEILEVNDGESLTIHVDTWLHEDAIIRPSHAPAGKAIKVLRVFVPKTDKAAFPYYWDITGQGAIAQLLPLLESGSYTDRAFKLSASGVGPKKRYAVEVLPL